jgi:zinc finger FYVE domain-containing protein 26
MKLMTVILNDEQTSEQHKLSASCDMYNNLVDILNRLNMANCSLPALNDLLQQDTLRKIRNQLLDDERYQLAMDISTRCNLDTQTIWFQWGMGN